MTDEELAAIKANAEASMSSVFGIVQISEIEAAAVADRWSLLADVLLMREIMREVADGPLSYSEQPQGWVCSLCGAITPDEWGQHSYSNESESDRAKRVIQHANGCPVTKARAILGQ